MASAPRIIEHKGRNRNTPDTYAVKFTTAEGRAYRTIYTRSRLEAEAWSQVIEATAWCASGHPVPMPGEC